MSLSAPGAGRRRFAPSPVLTLVALALAALFVRLGVWQWHRGLDREAAWQRFARGADRVLDLDAGGGTSDVSTVAVFQRVRVSGRLDGAHQFLLDNLTYRGRAGYEVLTPLERDRAPALLVDRGWVPFTGSRAHLPDVAVESAGVSVTGRLAELPAAGLASGRAPPDASARWPKVTSYPSFPELRAALGEPIAERILLLDPAEPRGFAREWRPPGLAPARHFAYAIQWWVFATLALGGWVLLGMGIERRR